MVLSIGYLATVPECLDWKNSNGLTYTVLSDNHGDVTLSYTNFGGFPILPWDAIVSVDRIVAYTAQTYMPGGFWNIAAVIAVFDSLFQPIPTSNPDALDFGNVVVGMSEDQTITLDNAGTGLLEVQDVVSSSPDISVDITQGQVYAVDDSLTITVTFAPLTEQTYNETLTIVTPDSNLVIPVTGVGENVSVGSDPARPDIFTVSCYPNPFNAELTIQVGLEIPQDVSISLYNLQGCKQMNLWQGRLGVGKHTLRWADEEAPSGLYFVEISGENWKQVRKVALTR